MAKSKKKDLPMLVVASKVKEANKEVEMRTDGEFIDALNEKVHALIAGAQDRASGNNRSTVRPVDL